jgi:acetyltransferase-like isoleucine patch superfamily enzyme
LGNAFGGKIIVQRIVSAFRRRLDPIGYARSIGVTVGDRCRLIGVTFSTEPYLVQIGDHVSATKTHFETHDGGVWVFRDEHPELDIVRPIRVGDNVYFGYGCIVLPGVTIGSNVVIGAGSIVTRDIPDNSVSVGIPARVIKRLEEYSATALASAHSTKHMSSDEKRVYYTGIYGAE